jgi:hypothetical protein
MTEDTPEIIRTDTQPQQAAEEEVTMRPEMTEIILHKFAEMRISSDDVVRAVGSQPPWNTEEVQWLADRYLKLYAGLILPEEWGDEQRPTG